MKVERRVHKQGKRAEKTLMTIMNGNKNMIVFYKYTAFSSLSSAIYTLVPLYLPSVVNSVENENRINKL